MLASAVLIIEQAVNDAVTLDGVASGLAVPAEVPMGCREVLGESSVERTVKRLQHAGIAPISVVAPNELSDFVYGLSQKYRDVSFVPTPSWKTSSWKTTNDLWQRLTKSGEPILVIKSGAYVEFDVANLLQFHQARGEDTIRLHDSQGPLDLWVLGSANTLADSIVPWLSEITTDVASSYVVNGYVNRLRNWNDLQTLAADIFLARCEAKPSGREVRPGIWLADGARVHRTANLVAPAYIGRATRVGAATMITACSHLEHHCEVGYGTLVKHSSVLPYTCIGNELHLSHAVVDGVRLLDTRKNVTVIIGDSKLLSSTAPTNQRRPAETEHLRKEKEVAGLKHLPYRGAVLPRVLGFLEDEL